MEVDAKKLADQFRALSELPPDFDPASEAEHLERLISVELKTPLAWRFRRRSSLWPLQRE